MLLRGMAMKTVAAARSGLATTATMPAAMTASTAEPCESGPAMARRNELRQATTRAVMQALMQALAMPMGR